MQGLWAVYKKELSDHFSSYRFVMLFALIAMVSFITSSMAGLNLRASLEGMEKQQYIFLMLFNTTGALFSMVQFVAFFGPLIGIVLGFDAINRERAHGTLIKVVSQPIYRDAVVNGKFLAGVTTITIALISIVLMISGFGLAILGAVPSAEEIWRLFFYVIISIFYISFWLGISILFSILFRGIATSALASLALWIFLSFFVSMAADVIAKGVAPVDKASSSDPEKVMENLKWKERVSLISPIVLYRNATATVIDPMRNTTKSMVLMGPLEQLSASRFQNPLSLGQSVLVVYPHIVAMIAITLICFAISYLVFMVQEIRT